MESLLYLAAIVVIVALGFAFAVWLMQKGIRDSEHDWEVKLAAQEQEGATLASSGARAVH